MIVAPGRPGRRRRRAAAGLRHHPRRVPARTRAGRGRRSSPRSSRSAAASAWSWPARSSTRSATAGCSGCPLIVVVVGRRRRPLRRPGVAGPRAGPDQLARRRAAVRLAGRAAARRSAEAPAWGWGSTRVLGLLLRRRRAAGRVGRRRVALREPADRHADDAAARRSGRPTWSRCCSASAMYAAFALPAAVPADPARRPATASAPRVTESGLLLLPHARDDVRRRASSPAGWRTASAPRRCWSSAPRLRRGLPRVLALRTTRSGSRLVSTAVLGIGFGLAFAAMANLIVAAVPPEQTGVASGMNANIRTIGGSIGRRGDGQHRGRPRAAERPARRRAATASGSRCSASPASAPPWPRC